MEIRPIRPENRAEWIRMRDALWPSSLPDHEMETQHFFTRHDRYSTVFVIDRLDGRLGGFIEVGCRDYAEGCTRSPVAYIEGWYVDADLRRTGYGRQLVEAAERWALSLGFQEIASDTELDNETSIVAHQAIGYEEVDRIVCFRKSLGNEE